jgi:hypothetical protein
MIIHFFPSYSTASPASIFSREETGKRLRSSRSAFLACRFASIFPKIEFFYAVSRGTLHKFDFNYFIYDWRIFD